MTPTRFALLGLLTVSAAFSGACAGLATSSNTAGKTIVPASTWDCGMPVGIPAPEQGTLVLEAEVKLDAIYDVGQTPFGKRQAVVTQAGTFKGQKIEGTVLTGGLDYQLTLANGVVEVEQILVLRLRDNQHVIMRNAGVGASAGDVRVVYDFEASTTGAFAWLNTGKFVGRRTIDAATKTMRFSIYDVSAPLTIAQKIGDPDSPAFGSPEFLAKSAAATARITKPTGVPPQPWDYRHADPSEQKGETILTESVGLEFNGPKVQNGKRGNRNVIPITGGTVTGLVAGKVLFGGADYQNVTKDAGPPIDARYLWQTTEGDIIIVRNTTNPVVGLVPTFETRVDGKYAWLNSGKYLSSPPGMGAGGLLSISMYKVK
jgi:hypothetical protein